MTKFLTCLCACFCLSRPVMAWFQEGHMVVAQIAYNHLDSAVKAKCDALIAVPLPFADSKSTNFVTASSWADDYKGSLGTGTSHYIDLPFSLDGYPTNGLSYGPPNVVSAITQCATILLDPNAGPTNQATALRYLIHFVGDIHQPLHSSTAVYTNKPTGDAGGNGFSITGWGGELHAFWDGGGAYMTDSVSRPLTPAGVTIITNKANDVEATYPYPLSVGSIPDPMTWALEGWNLSQTVCYVGISSNTSPSTTYINTATATAKQRVALGGQRLAKLLNTIFVTNAPALTSVTLSNGNFGLSWGAVPGRSYRVQWKQQVGDAAWTDLTDITATTNTALFTEVPGQDQKFYRLIIVN